MKQFFKILESIAILLIIATITSNSVDSVDENEEKSKLGTEEDIVVSEEQSNKQNTVESSTTEEKTISGVCGENLTWAIDDEGCLTISGTGEMYDYDHSYNNNSPWRNREVKTVLINEGVTSIGDWAFSSCSNLTSITIPDSVVSIGDFAFEICINLKDVYYSGTEDTWKTVSIDAGNDILTNATIHYNDTHSINSNNSVAVDTVGDIFSNDKLAYEVLDDGTLMVRGKADLMDVLEDVNIPSELNGKKVTRIRELAFSWAAGGNPKSIIIPNSITSIGYSAFDGCSNLTSITLPDNIKAIADYTFSGCVNLTSITIPNNVAKIGNYAFAGCSALTTITIPDSVTRINPGIFFNCINLTSVDISNNIKSISKKTFENCTSLESIKIPNGIEEICSSAFFNCSNLTSITIPKSITNIEENVFERTNLRDVYYSGTEDEWKKIKISYSNEDLKKATIHYNAPESSDNVNEKDESSLQKSNDNLMWKLDENKILTINGTGEMYGYGLLFDIETMHNVNASPWGDYCHDIKSIILNDGITSIGIYAFYDCTNLISVSIPDSVNRIEQFAFSGCLELKDVYYSGTEDTWKTVSIDVGNDALTNATIHYNDTRLIDGNNNNLFIILLAVIAIIIILITAIAIITHKSKNNL